MELSAQVADEYRLKKVFLFIVASLASTILLKVAQIQYLELVYATTLLILLIDFARKDYTVRWFKPFVVVGASYMLFLLIALVLSVAALRFQFYFPSGMSTLKSPLIVTISRSAEVFTSMFFMLYVADVMRRREELGRYAMRVYFWTGIASAVYSIVTYPLNVAGIANLGTYSIQRMRGFYNEGGSYGLYVISVYLVGFALYKLEWEEKKRLFWASLVLTVAFFGSKSKGAIFAALVILLINVLISGGVLQRLVLLGGSVVFIIVAMQFVDIESQVRAYLHGAAIYERASHFYSSNPSYVLGRIAGIFIVPKTIAAHPWTGIGWGNYGVLRNAPEYRGAAVWVDIQDDPALGFVQAAADFGLPLFGLLLICFILPVAYVRSRKAPAYIVNLALLQPVAHLFAAQLNLTYPWVASSFALGLAVRNAWKKQGDAVSPSDSPQGAAPSASRTE